MDVFIVFLLTFAIVCITLRYILYMQHAYQPTNKTMDTFQWNSMTHEN